MTRLVLDAPTGSLIRITTALVEEAIAASRASPRRRIILPFHKGPESTLHRMLNAVQPDSYIRPHRHLTPPKDEAFVVLRGALVFFAFEDDGRVRERVALAAGGDAFGVDIAAGAYHTFIATAADTVIYEAKTGPYTQASDKAFAPWAPEEGAPDVSTYMQRLLGPGHVR
jgi:cupin fold WbuC family metalloprotein